MPRHGSWHRPGKNPDWAEAELDDDEYDEAVVVVSKKAAAGVAAATTTFTTTFTTAAVDWVMLHPCIVLRKPRSGETATEVSDRTATGFAFSVSLDLAPPPSPSSVVLHCPRAVVPPTLMGLRFLSMAIAADANLLLLSIILPVKPYEEDNYYVYPEEYFVYAADPVAPTLTRLPAFPDDCVRPSGCIGIVSQGTGGGFAVAALQMVVETNKKQWKEMAELCLFFPDSDDHKWNIKKLTMPYDSEKRLEPLQWTCGTVFSYAAKLYWVDYNIGLLFCDVFARSPKLRFVKFPVPKVKPGLRFANDNCPQLEPFRTVDVSDGKIKFIDVDNCRSQASLVIIRTWNLQMPEMVWEEDGVLDVKHLWETCFKKISLPQLVPKYPTVDKLDSHIVHFILEGAGVWMITVDMRTKSVKSCSDYISGDDYYQGKFVTESFLCCGLSKYLR